MKRLFVSAVVCLMVLATAAGILIIQDWNRTARASEPFTSLGPWPLEVLKPGVLGYGMRFQSPSTGNLMKAFDWTAGSTLRSSDSMMKAIEVPDFEGLNGEKAQVYLDSRDNAILGVKNCSFYSISPQGDRVALVFPDTIVVVEPGKASVVVTPSTIGDEVVAEYRGRIEQNPYLFNDPVWTRDGTKLAYRSRLGVNGIAAGYNIWVADTSSGTCRVVREGQSEGQINQLFGWMDGRILFLDPGLGVGLLDAGTESVSILTKSTVTQLVVSPTDDGAVGVDADYDLVLLKKDGTSAKLTGLGPGEDYSYGACWSPDGSRVAFVISTTGPDETLIAIGERNQTGISVTKKNACPEPDYQFTAGGPLSWLNNDSLVVSAEARTNRFQAKSWLMSAPGKAGAAK